MSTSTFLGYAFRPFFLLNAFFALLAVAGWLWLLGGQRWPGAPEATIQWHGHEMLGGFVLAAVAGFSLTAVATWTGRTPVRGAPLGILVAAWLAGRLVMAFSGTLPPLLVIATDMLFPLLLAGLLSREVLAAANRRNYPVAGVAVLFAALNLAWHLGQVYDPAISRKVLVAFIHLAVLLVTLIGGRIIPNFTANWLRLPENSDLTSRKPSSQPWLEKLIFACTGAVAILAVFTPSSSLTGILALAAAVAHALRLSRWCGFATRSNPLLFILHITYAWLPLGYMVMGMNLFTGLVDAGSALHALTFGALTGMIVAVTTRVALGHTGRALKASPVTVAAYVIFNVAALVRVFGMTLGLDYYQTAYLSGAGWMLTFLLFILAYLRILTTPRLNAP